MSVRGRGLALDVGATLLLAVVATGLLAVASLHPAASSTAASDPDAPGAAGTLRAAGTGATGADATGADASIAGRVAVSPIVLRLEALPRKPKGKGLAEIRATAANLSAGKVPVIALSVGATPAALAIRPVEARVIRNLAAGKTADATWTLCTASAGTFQLVATAVVGATVVQSQVVEVTLDASRC